MENTSPSVHSQNSSTHRGVLNATLLVVGIGYFIDIFDLFLYNVLRVSSLRDLGVAGDALAKTGLHILNLQVIGMIVGGLVWGVLADRIGRKKALLGAIGLYSLGSFGCAFVNNVEIYALMRFLTGIGLAGEMGLGAILITENAPNEKRDWGLLAYTVFAYLGIIAASLMGGAFPWRTCYAIGGACGLILLLARMVLLESGLFQKAATQPVARGSIKLLLGNRKLLIRWLCCALFAIPYYYIPNLLITLAPEFGRAANTFLPIEAGTALMCYSAAAIVGTALTVLISRLLRRRLLTIILFMLVNAGLAWFYVHQWQPSAFEFYTLCTLMGLANFYTVFLFTAVEQFGTNMRGTAGNSALSMGRATLVITNSIFLAFRDGGHSFADAAQWTGVIVFAIGFLCLFGLKETYGRSLDFHEGTESGR